MKWVKHNGWEKAKEAIASILLVFALGWIEYHLYWLLRLGGEITIREGKPVILFIEIGFVALLIVLAVERMIKDWRA